VVSFELGGLEVRAVLRTGGMGTVYLGWDPPLHRWVAVKVIRADLAHRAEFREAFRREARLAATVSHPNLIRIYAFGEEDGIPYLAMEHVTAETLAERIEREGPLSYPAWRQLAEGLTAALAMMAQRGILHCDIKPGNVLVDAAGVARLTDFGLAMAQADDAVRGPQEEIWGTPYYLAPERAWGEPLTERSEVYSLGATLYHAATGRPPIDGETVEDLLRRLRAGQEAALPSAAAPQLPLPARRLILSMVSADPSGRIPSFAAVTQALSRLPAVWRPVSRPKRTIIITMILVLAAQVLVIWMAARRHQQRPPPESTPPSASSEPPAQSATTPPLTPPIASDTPSGAASESPAQAAAPPPDAPPTSTLPQATAWEQARQLLAAGKLAEALPQLEPLAGGDPPVPEALDYRHLAQLWVGLARLATGEREPAEAALAALLEESSKAEPAMASTETATAAAAAGIGLGTPAAQELVTKAAGAEAAAIGSLILALRQAGGDAAAALAELESFRGHLAAAGTPWWGSAAGALADSLRADATLLQAALAKAAEREAAGDLAGATSELRKAVGEATHPACRQQLETRLTSLAEKEAAAERKQEEERKRLEVERWKEERAKAQALDQTIAPLLAQMEYGQAAQEVRTLLGQVETELVAERLRVQLAYLEAAETVVHSMVIAVARHLGFSAVVRTRDGRSVPGLVRQITRRDISLQATPSGSVLLQWTEVLPPSLLEIALQGFLLDERGESATAAEHRQRYQALERVARAWGAPALAARAAGRRRYWERQAPVTKPPPPAPGAQSSPPADASSPE